MNEAPTPFNKELTINSDKNNPFLVKINTDEKLNFNINSINKVPKISFENKFSLQTIRENKYFSLCENMSDIILTLKPILDEEKNISLREEEKNIKLIIKLPHPKCPKIIFPFEIKKKDINESITELYDLIEKLNNKVNEQQNEINKLNNKINEQEKEISKSKGKDFSEIYNLWTTDKFQYGNGIFYYTLKNDNYLAEKTNQNDYIHLIKSSYRFIKGKIYKLEFIVNYKSGGDYHIGFGDFNKRLNALGLKIIL